MVVLNKFSLWHVTAQLAHLSAPFLHWWEVSCLIWVYADSSFFFLSKLSCPELVCSAVWRLKKGIVFSLEHLFCCPGLAWISVNGLHQHISLLWSFFLGGHQLKRGFTASHLRYHSFTFNTTQKNKVLLWSSRYDFGLWNLGVSRLWLNFQIWLNFAFKAATRTWICCWFWRPADKSKKKKKCCFGDAAIPPDYRVTSLLGLWDLYIHSQHYTPKQ